MQPTESQLYYQIISSQSEFAIDFEGTVRITNKLEPFDHTNTVQIFIIIF